MLLIVEQTKLDDCADMFITIAKNTSMTGQKIEIGKNCALSSMTLLTPCRCWIDKWHEIVEAIT